ncbi:MAG: hypothetical protein PUC59_08525 [Firmicutes bacterium]|nr:hypothetical protein [Bacillota bacterium]
MEKMSRQEKILIVLALVLCAVFVVYLAVEETRAQPQAAWLSPGLFMSGCFSPAQFC